MLRSQQDVKHARIVAMARALSQRKIGRHRFVGCQLLRVEDPDRAQVGRDGLADVRHIFQPECLSFVDGVHDSPSLRLPAETNVRRADCFGYAWGRLKGKPWRGRAERLGPLECGMNGRAVKGLSA